MIIAEKFYAEEEVKRWNETRKLQLCHFFDGRTGRRKNDGTIALLEPKGAFRRPNAGFWHLQAPESCIYKISGFPNPSRSNPEPFPDRFPQ